MQPELHLLCVNQIVLLMGIDETNVNLVVLVVNSDYQSKLIVTNIKNCSIVANNAGLRIFCFQIVRCIPDFLFYFLVPSS